ncbi:PREDICTED: olfactory receptor 7D2-like [Amphimedon queenslandica]|uniref:G-protein coupled receptors family 1 profile domain-containing protein n=1 Tax=Amphimedon queenslandica TaxID=400682 RepID=A0A1X7VF15_AMPQE|nr:PREDICTED: olfactory receptor 7D2-like [Amphimedon queenslandica]|eukprot:XP_011410390.1 PREDICTED: olfactory receptor 7D2-like [Amphimedon queenslandica]
MSLNSTDFLLTGDINAPVFSAILGIEAVIGIIANIGVLLVTLYEKKSWTKSSTMFFTSHLLANLNVSFSLLLFSIAIGAKEWIFGITPQGKNQICIIVAYTYWNSALIIAMTLSAISFDRFLFIVKPHFHKEFMTPRVALILTITLWLLGSMINTTPFYGIGQYGYFSSYGICTNIFQNTSMFYLTLNVSIYSAIYLTIAVMTIWTFCYTRGFIKEQATMVGSDGVYLSKEKRLFGIFGSMLIAFIITVLPGYTIGFISAIYPLQDNVYLVNIAFNDSIIMTNPFIQLYFRPEIKSLIGSLTKKIRNKFKMKQHSTRIRVVPINN